MKGGPGSIDHQEGPTRVDHLVFEETGERLTTVRDSLYDRMTLQTREVALLGTPEFLRLDGIKQMGFVSRVWPGAKHSRFEHSLGVLALVRRALDTLRPALAATPQPRPSDLDAIAARSEERRVGKGCRSR